MTVLVPFGTSPAHPRKSRKPEIFFFSFLSFFFFFFPTPRSKNRNQSSHTGYVNILFQSFGRKSPDTLTILHGPGNAETRRHRSNSTAADSPYSPPNAFVFSISMPDAGFFFGFRWLQWFGIAGCWRDGFRLGCLSSWLDSYAIAPPFSWGGNSMGLILEARSSHFFFFFHESVAYSKAVAWFWDVLFWMILNLSQKLCRRSRTPHLFFVRVMIFQSLESSTEAPCFKQHGGY